MGGVLGSLDAACSSAFPPCYLPTNNQLIGWAGWPVLFFITSKGTNWSDLQLLFIQIDLDSEHLISDGSDLRSSFEHNFFSFPEFRNHKNWPGGGPQTLFFIVDVAK